MPFIDEEMAAISSVPHMYRPPKPVRGNALAIRRPYSLTGLIQYISSMPRIDEEMATVNCIPDMYTTFPGGSDALAIGDQATDVDPMEGPLSETSPKMDKPYLVFGSCFNEQPAWFPRSYRISTGVHSDVTRRTSNEYSR
ncbi:hypothetical protein [Ktedonospora formicarum]|uniref:hypothetical protein n=1 Tax=Ktedonospora formicarum TaxID=2778364 RepID=UPI001C68DF34|nr:hypothetical protein [Ktedonospora formicarum]